MPNEIKILPLHGSIAEGIQRSKIITKLYITQKCIIKSLKSCNKLFMASNYKIHFSWSYELNSWSLCWVYIWQRPSLPDILRIQQPVMVALPGLCLIVVSGCQITSVISDIKYRSKCTLMWTNLSALNQLALLGAKDTSWQLMFLVHCYQRFETCKISSSGWK